MAEEAGSFWGRFRFVEPFKKFIDAKEKGITWSDSDVEAFIAVDPVHGPIVENARKAAKVAAIGSAVGALHLGGTALRYSKSPHGTVLALGLGAVVGYTVGKEAASHYYQLYRADTMASQVKFLEWVTTKSEGRS
ncbi:hypothetical protein MKW94_025788 [Papaver nudicaule]|uniref:Succinate dehydrogenase subunit 6, mitochondrial n=1 Tax=Papaver nudicaule TaxID=74823 RepID=A0AA41SCW7_PAPNU|nr:hypothetical protein [Papaver nudicaule]